MRYFGSKLFVGIAFLLATAEVAQAQMGPGMGGPMGPGGGMNGPTNPSGEKEKEGVAEAAPKTPGLLPTTPALPPPKGRRKRWKLFELGGYYRMRTDWFKNFNLGFNDDPAQGGAPFPRSLSCTANVSIHAPCSDTLSDTNMRLRLEPVLNIDEGTSVHVQADVLDNLVLGSTPVDRDLSGIYTGMAGTPTQPSTRPPLGAFGSNQAAPQAGINSNIDSITIKRAWAEVAVPLGVLKFGRMPNHWGMGVYANGGGYDPINGTYDYDADYGDTVDRVSFSLQIPGTSLRAMIASDWAFTGLTTGQLPGYRGQENHTFSLDQDASTSSYVGVISKMDSPQEWRDAIDRGENALNYGVYFEYRNQSWDEDLTGYTAGSAFDSLDHYVPRNYKAYTASLWGKAGIGAVTLETELVGILGSLDRADDQGITGSLSIRKFGGVGRLTWTGVEGKLRLGLESGFATGDQWDNTPEGSTNIAYANLIGGPNDSTLTQFIFNREYKVDMILWHRLYGAVTNAVYGKPFLQYDLTKSILFKVANITSGALRPVATPGNSTMLGTEFDTDLGYHTDRFFAGISYGLLFAFAGEAHPASSSSSGVVGGQGFSYDQNGAMNVNDAGTAHCIQMRLILAF
jgi:uncharacterized protein (TIGR04551 family)